MNKLSPEDVQWIVNDSGELGVKIDGQCFFLYKGESLQYEDGKHDNGDPILHRRVGKREFGESCLAPNYTGGAYDEPCIHDPVLSHGPPNNPDFEWTPLPTPNHPENPDC